MRAVFVNHLHPATPHVGAMRVREFARAMAARGHRVVLLTADRPGGEAPPSPESLPAALAGHDWGRPFPLACPPLPAPVLEAQRAGRLPRPLRRAVLAWHFLVHGGVFPDWTAGSRPYWPVLARHFRPEVTWGTFGNSDAWRIAQGVARLSACPWVADVKDAWDLFIPAPFRPLLARRFADAASLTGLSEGYLAHTGAFFPQPRQVVYSGFPAALLEQPGPTGPAFRVTVTGSLYSDAGADALAEGVRLWLAKAPPDIRETAVFTYAGGDRRRMERAAGRLDGLCRLDLHDFLPLDALVALQREAFLNVYARLVGSADAFHHKLFELLAAGRPIACIPEEMPEATALAAAAGGAVISCADPSALAAALAGAWSDRAVPPAPPAGLAPFTWEGQAGRLEAVLRDAMGRASP